MGWLIGMYAFVKEIIKYLKGHFVFRRLKKISNVLIVHTKYKTKCNYKY